MKILLLVLVIGAFGTPCLGMAQADKDSKIIRAKLEASEREKESIRRIAWEARRDAHALKEEAIHYRAQRDLARKALSEATRSKMSIGKYRPIKTTKTPATKYPRPKSSLGGISRVVNRYRRGHSIYPAYRMEGGVKMFDDYSGTWIR